VVLDPNPFQIIENQPAARWRQVAGAIGLFWTAMVLLKDFGSHVERVSRRLKGASLAPVDEQH
jgi:hypothetical protein